MNHYKNIQPSSINSNNNSPGHKTRTIPISLLSARSNTRHPINGRPNPVDMTKTYASISPLPNLAINQPKPNTIRIHVVHSNRRVRWVKSNPTPKNHGLLINHLHRMNNSHLTVQPNYDISKPSNLHYNNSHYICIIYSQLSHHYIITIPHMKQYLLSQPLP